MKMDATSRDAVSSTSHYHTEGPYANPAAVDYNSWIESPKGRKLSAKLDKDVVLAEGMRIHIPSHTLCAR